MGFLDNLENSLNQMERGSEREDERADAARRDAEAAAERKVAPVAEALKKSAFLNTLLTECMTLGHTQRTRVGMAWIGNTLRLDAKEKRLELQPTADGVVGVFLVNGEETGRTNVGLCDDAKALAKKWLVG